MRLENSLENDFCAHGSVLYVREEVYMVCVGVCVSTCAHMWVCRHTCLHVCMHMWCACPCVWLHLLMCRDTHVEVSGHPQMLSLPFSLSETLSSLLLYARLAALQAWTFLLSPSLVTWETGLHWDPRHLGYCIWDSVWVPGIWTPVIKLAR